MFLITISFVVYSWNEPTNPMPDGYTPPLNTSSNPQTKKGDLTFTMMYDYNGCNEEGEDCPYYINPSGNSVVSGKIVTEAQIEDTDSSGTMVNKGYVDSKIGSTIMEDVPAAKLYYVQDVSSTCPAGTTEVGRKCCSSCDWYGAGVSCGGSSGHIFAKMCAGPDPESILP